MNHDFHLRASMVFLLDEITMKKTVTLKDKTGQINLSLNKMSDIQQTMGFSNYYNDMSMKLVKDVAGKRHIRFKFSKSDNQDMIYTNDCGIEFSPQKYPADEQPQFELEIKSHFLKGLMDLSHRNEENLLFNFLFNQNKIEFLLHAQNIQVQMDCNFINKSEKLDSQKQISYVLYHKFCKRLSQCISFESPLKFGMSFNNELYIDCNISSGVGLDEGVAGKFRFLIPVMVTKAEDVN